MIVNNLTGGGILSRRRRFMTQRVERPYASEVEYLEVTAEGGQAWIDTEYVPTGNDVNLRFEFTLNGYENPVTGIPWVMAKSSGSNAYGIQRYSTSPYINGACGRVIDITRWAYTNTNYPLTFMFKLGFEEATINNAKWNNYNLQTVGPENNSSLKIFSYLEGSYVKGRIYFLQLDKGGIPQLDLIPVRVGSEGYMYDRVSGKLFGNSGTGHFILGPDIA